MTVPTHITKKCLSFYSSQRFANLAEALKQRVEAERCIFLKADIILLVIRSGSLMIIYLGTFFGGSLRRFGASDSVLKNLLRLRPKKATGWVPKLGPRGRSTNTFAEKKKLRKRSPCQSKCATSKKIEAEIWPKEAH